MGSLSQKISALAFVKPNIPAPNYGRDIKLQAANTFTEFIKGKKIKLSDCGLFVDDTLQYVGAGPGRILRLML